jgi:hypothetical protein
MTMPGFPPGNGEVRQALRSIVSDPDYGAEALSSKRAMESLLKDLLPDKPRDAAILVAAAEHRVAAMLRERVDREGMDAATAIPLVAAVFARATAFTLDACEWAVTELAVALGIDATIAPAQPTVPERPASPVLSAITVPPAGMIVPPDFKTIPPGGRAAPPGAETAPAPRPIETPPGYDSSGFRQPGPRPRRRALWSAVAGAAAVAIAAGVIIALHKPPLPTPVITVNATSANHPVSGNVFVYYKDTTFAKATITATVSRGTKGEVAELTGQQYPFTARPKVLASTKIRGRHQHLSFRVSPSLETRYRIEVLRSSGAANALATSPAHTVYVALHANYKYTQNSCPRPKCYLTIQFRVPVAHAALQTEAAKHVYVYWGINLVASGPRPPRPKTLDLQKQLSTSQASVLGADEYQVILAFNFTVNQDGYTWSTNICTKADVAADGIGLPGTSQCGGAAIAGTSPGYIGSLAG